MQTALMDQALARSGPTVADRAAVIAVSYIECVLAQGREIPEVIAALTGSPELEKIKRECEKDFIEKCRLALVPFTGALPVAALWAMLGAAESLSYAAAKGEITAADAHDELIATILAMVARSRDGLG